MRTTRAAMAAVALAAVLMVCLSACDHTEAPVVTEKPPRCFGQTPEQVLNNLIVSYGRRDIEEYASLLHPDFIFRFQDGDAPADLGREYWNATEDSTGTDALFNSPEVTGIYIDLTYRDAEPATEVDLLGTMKIRVTPMKLTVDDRSGWTWLVEGDIQDFFFVRGEGADSLCWYIKEWRDIPGYGGVGSPEDGVHAVAVESMSWGSLKTRY